MSTRRHAHAAPHHRVRDGPVRLAARHEDESSAQAEPYRARRRGVEIAEATRQRQGEKRICRTISSVFVPAPGGPVRSWETREVHRWLYRVPEGYRAAYPAYAGHRGA